VAACTRVLLAAAIVAAATQVRAAEVVVVATPITLEFAESGRTTVGKLEFRGGLRLAATITTFGGLSGLRVSSDGSRLLAITDRAGWLRADLRYDARGVLTGIEHVDLTAMLDADGRALVPPRADAESLVRTASAVFVAFERQHRVLRFDADANGPAAGARGRAEPAPTEFAQMPMNEGLEAMTALGDGRLFVISEGAFDGDAVRAWVLAGAGRPAEALRYVPAAGFNPTDATTLPNGDVLVLERRFTVFDRGARIVRIAAADIRNGARLAGEEIARLLPPVQVDNFEGIDAIADPAGGVRVFLLSDDNFSAFQRTLLLQFWMP
jgi:hypothetical protein